MSVVYAESSAILSWLLGESSQDAIVAELSGATIIGTSTLTVIECSRALARARNSGRIQASDELMALRMLDQAAASWHVHDISDRVAQVARGAFPREPVRTLDALHLATAAVFAEAVGSLRMLSLDERVRTNAAALGMELAPA